MTGERAIRSAQKWAFGGVCTLKEGEAQEYHKLCLAALRAQQEQEDPKPLTLDELRQMDGEPVLVVADEGAKLTTPGYEPLSFFALVEVAEKSIFLTNNLGGRTEYAADAELEYDGITVYRHKPREEV